MSIKIKLFSAVLAISGAAFLLLKPAYVNGAPASQTTPPALLSNPINNIQSGSMIYTLSDKTKLTQLALDTEVEMDITGVINRVSVKQKFTNPSNDYVEGVYVFPLPEDSAIDHLKMHIGNRTIEGQIQTRKQARSTYKKAKKSGKKATLVEQQRPNMFTTNVANIAPGESVIVQIEYQQSVQLDNNQFSIRFPTTVGQRYIPGKPIATQQSPTGTMPNTHRVKDASKITPPILDDVDRAISIGIKLKAGFDIDDISSAYHDIQVTKFDQLTQYIELKEGKTQANRDFEISWRAKATSMPKIALFTQQKDQDHYLMLMATPQSKQQLQNDYTPREVIFIIDSSGSMSGASMIQAKQALNKAVNRLKPTDRFNIIDFDSGFESFYDSALPALDLTKKMANRFTQSLQADGGTEPIDAVKFAFGSRDMDSDNYLRQVIFITDGQVGNEDEVLNTVRQSIDDDKLFTIGIGSAPNSFFMTKMASYGNGAFTYIGDINEVEEKMNTLFAKLESPALTDIAIEFPPQVNAHQANDVIGDLYSGEVISAVFKINALPNSLSVSGKNSENIFNQTIQLDKANNAKGLDVLWARRKIEKLMDEYRSQHRRIDQEPIKQAITQIALDHHLVSDFTSLVAVDITSTKPANKSTKTQAVANQVKAAKTATNADFWMLLGVMIILSAIVLGMRSKK